MKLVSWSKLAKATCMMLLLSLIVSGISGCSLFPKAPPEPPPWALIVLEKPVMADVTIIDDLGYRVHQKVILPAGWRVMQPKPKTAP